MNQPMPKRRAMAQRNVGTDELAGRIESHGTHDAMQRVAPSVLRIEKLACPQVDRERIQREVDLVENVDDILTIPEAVGETTDRDQIGIGTSVRRREPARSAVGTILDTTGVVQFLNQRVDADPSDEEVEILDAATFAQQRRRTTPPPRKTCKSGRR